LNLAAGRRHSPGMTTVDPFSPHALPDPGLLLGCVPRLRRYARVLRRNHDDADDLVQDTLERAWSRAGLWPGVGDMRTWLFSIMHNLHVDALRRGRLETVDLGGEALDLPDAVAVSERLDLQALQRAFDALPAEQQAVLDLVAVQGLGYAEAAMALGVPIGTVMSRLSRARDRLRQGLAPRRAALRSRGGGNSPPHHPST
jgi:RNA polymerase sigma factor (sigma-70 family)